MLAPGKIAAKAASVAQGFAAAHTHEEGGDNHGPEVDKMLEFVGCQPGDPWCAAMMRFCEQKAETFLQAASETAAIPETFPRSGYCPDYANWARKQGEEGGASHGAWISVQQAQQGFISPERGDLICFYFSAKGRIAHIGIVTGTWDGGVLTVEGNTSDGTGVDRDGDGVYRRRRRWSELGSKGGFVRLFF